ALGHPHGHRRVAPAPCARTVSGSGARARGNTRRSTMSDPPRLSTLRPGGLGARMLDSARDDDPPAASRQRALAAFGVGAGAMLSANLAEGGAGLSAGGAAAGGSVTKVALWTAVAKWGGGGALLALCTTAAVSSLGSGSFAGKRSAPDVVA